MTDDKLLEEIARMIVGEPSKVQAPSGRWVDDPLHEMDVQNEMEKAKKILSKVQEHSVRLADEQTFPQDDGAIALSTASAGYKYGQKRMWDAGFRKIEE